MSQKKYRKYKVELYKVSHVAEIFYRSGLTYFDNPKNSHQILVWNIDLTRIEKLAHSLGMHFNNFDTASYSKTKRDKEILIAILSASSKDIANNIINEYRLGQL